MKRRINYITGLLWSLLLGAAFAVPLALNPGESFIAGLGVFLTLHFAKRPEGVAGEGLVINDTSYAGEVLDQFITLLSTSFQTMKKGCMAVMPGIKKKKTIPTLKVQNFIQARLATPKHGGDVNIDARELEPQDFMGYLEFNPRDFEQHWYAAKMNPKLLDAELPATAESAIIQKVLDENGTYMDKAVWQSVKDEAAITDAETNGLGDGDNNLIFFDGLIYKMVNDVDVIKVANPVNFTVGNIYDEIERAKEVVPEAVYEHPDFKWMGSYKTSKLVKAADVAQNYKGADKAEGGRSQYDDKPVVSLAGMPDNTLVGCLCKDEIGGNLWFGVNEPDEEEELQLARLQKNSELFFIKMLMKCDVNYAFSEQTVLYTTVTFA